jgi:peptide deformylase
VTGADTPVLRTEGIKVPKVTKEILRLIKNMEETLEDEGGLGLAAPQIGESKQICLARFAGKLNVLINPEITWRSEETIMEEEGCLSLPKITVEVSRPREVAITYLNEKGEKQERHLIDMDARVVQHETDHLNGVMIVDYMKSSITESMSQNI